MLEVYAILFFTTFIQQSNTSPPQTINDWVILILIGYGGLALFMKWLSDRQKNWMEQQEANRTQDVNQSETLTKLADALKMFGDLLGKTADTAEERNATQFRMANLMADQNGLFDQLTEKVREMKTELSSGRTEIISKVAEKIGEADTKAATRHTEDAQLFSAVRADVAAVKTDLDEKATEILRRLDEKPSVTSQQEITRQFTDLLTEIKSRLAAIEARLPVVEPRPTVVGTADGAALAGDGVIAPSVVANEGTAQ